MSSADVLLKELAQACVDHTFEKVFRRFLAPDLLIVDDFGLRRLTAQQSQDLYELIIERHRRSGFAFTSNRGGDEWLGLFDFDSTRGGDVVIFSGEAEINESVPPAHEHPAYLEKYRAEITVLAPLQSNSHVDIRCQFECDQRACAATNCRLGRQHTKVGPFYRRINSQTPSQANIFSFVHAAPHSGSKKKK